MPHTSAAPLRPRDAFTIDSGKVLFSLSTYLATALVLIIAFTASLPRHGMYS